MKKVGIVVAILLALSFFIFNIESTSMLPNLLPQDMVLVNPLAYFTKSPQRGDVIIFKRHQEKSYLVKRIVAVAGDFLQLKNQELWLNKINLTQQSLQDPQPSLKNSCLVFENESVSYRRELAHGKLVWQLIGQNPTAIFFNSPTDHDFQILVPEGYVVVLGDNRQHSRDSRHFGLIKIQDIFGRVLRVLASPNSEKLPCLNIMGQKEDAPPWGRWERLFKKIN